MAEITDPAALAQLNASGDDFLKQLAATHGQGYASLVKATAEGANAPPSGMAMRSPFGQQLVQDVYQYDPTADAVNLPARVAARKAFTSGKQGQNIVSIATALEHSANLDDAVTKLGNVQSPFPGTTHIVNSVRNSFRNADGNVDVTQFDNTVTPIVDELERAYTQTGGSVTAIKELRAGINNAQSMAQQRTAIQTFARLLQGKLEEQNKSYNLAMGTVGKTAPGISDQAQKLLAAYTSPDYINKGLPANSGSDAPPAVVAAGGGTPPANPPAGGASSGGGPVLPPEGPFDGPSTTPSAPTSDATHNEVDAKASGVLDGLIRQGLSADQINAEMTKQFGAGAFGAVAQKDVSAAQDYFKAHPNYRGSFGQANRTVVTPLAQRIVADTADTGMGALAIGATDALSLGTLPKIAAGAASIGQRITGDNRPLGDIYSSDLAGGNAVIDKAAQDEPLAFLGGNTAGFIGGDALIGKALTKIPGASSLINRIPGTLRPIVGDAAYGAAYGAGSSDSLADVPGNILKGGALAAGGGVLGRGLVKGVANVASPMANAAVRRLDAAGVTLTPGQILRSGGGLVGKMVGGIEDRAAGFPIIGDIINNARRGGVEDFNRAAINDALAPIGETASDVGHGGIEDAQKKVGDAYTKALSSMSAVPDGKFTTDLAEVGQKAKGLSQDHREALASILDTHVQPYLNGKKMLDGADLQSIKQGLDGEIADYSAPNASPQDKKLADRLGEVRDAVLDLAGRSDPASAADFQKANKAFSLMSRVNNAASKSKDGVFSPNQFRQAVTKRGYGTTTANVASGNAPMQQLATDASTILPSNVPDSGTAGRAALGLLAGKLGAPAAGAVLGGASGHQTPIGTIGGALLGAAAFTRPGLRVTQKILAGSRGRKLDTLGDLLRRNANLGGAVGSPLLLEKLTK